MVSFIQKAATTAAPMVRPGVLGALATNILGMQPDAWNRVKGQRSLVERIEAQAISNNPTLATKLGKGPEATPMTKPTAATSPSMG